MSTWSHEFEGPGRFAARIRFRAVRGVWPAFWILGTDIDEVGWPACGEIAAI